MRNRAKPTPYVMLGRPTNQPRPTVADPPDRRVPIVPQRPITLTELRVMIRPGATDPRLRAADRVLERWAATHGDEPTLPFAAAVTLSPRAPSKVAPLNDRESILVDSVVYTAPTWAKSFAVLWYRFACSTQEMAELLRIRRRQAVYEERHVVLAYYLGRFVEIGIKV